MVNDTRLTDTEGLALAATGQAQGWAKTTRSGRFVQSYLLPDGSWLEHWYNMPLGDRWFHLTAQAADAAMVAPRHQIVLRQEF